MNWTLEIGFHLPHDKLMLGWEYLPPSEDYNYSTIRVSLLIITLTLDF
jgi:hypothetical protein